MSLFNIDVVTSIADSLFSFSIGDSTIEKLEGGAQKLYSKCKIAADYVKNPYDPSWEDSASNYVIGVRSASNNVVEVIENVNGFISRAKSAGFLPPSNPFSEIAKFNQGRKIVVTGIVGQRVISPNTINEKLADDIIFNLNLFLEFLKREQSGEIDLTTFDSSAQVSSYTMSLDGFDFLQEGINDIMSFLPDADKIKRARFNAALGSLDFKNRIPNLLFTANYDPDDISRGAVIGWKRIPDASGYTINRHSIFENKDIEISLPNEAVEEKYKAVKDYVKEWILSFYDSIEENSIYAFLDKDIKDNNFYTYTLSAYQNVRTDNNFIFSVDASPFSLAFLQINDVENEMTSYIEKSIAQKFKGATFDSVSPYPFLSKKFYGHDKYDWMLAAMNFRESIERGDDRTNVRGYSYLGSSLSFVRNKMAEGKFVRPKDPSQIIANVKESIGLFGVSQTLKEIIDFTGLDLFFSSKEEPGDKPFVKATSVFDKSSIGSLSTVVSSIDPETATVDITSLVSNLLIATKGDDISSVDESLSPEEITLTSVDDVSFAEDVLHFVGEFTASQDVLDLTTFEGISDFVRIIRLFFDFSPNRRTFE